MKLAIRTATILFSIASCVLFVFCGVFVNSTYAVSPDEYVFDVVDEDKDWYFGENFLDIATLKTTVNSWFEDERVYNFSALERNPVVVAVIDSGINFNHQIFTGKYDENGATVESEGAGEYDVLYRDSEGNLICKNTVTAKQYASDDVLDDAPDMHGTHVAGTIAILIHELNLEKYIKILPIKAAYPKDSGSSFSPTTLANALEFAKENGADVINMSLTSRAANDLEYDRIITSELADSAVLVAAAGNNGKMSTTNVFGGKVDYYYPAANANVIGVMNLSHVGDKYALWSTSNYGKVYDLAAPGASIMSADGATNDGYKSLTGTSMATPIVSFGAALATLKYRAIAAATGENNAKDPREIANIIKFSYSSTLVYNKVLLKVFDMNVFASDDGLYSIYIDCDNSALEQTKGDVKKVKFFASLLPTSSENDELSNDIVWYLDNGEEEIEIGRGRSAEFTPGDEVGEYDIVARYTSAYYNLSATKTVTVDFVTPSKETTEIECDETEFEVGQTYVFNISDYLNCKDNVAVAWYVNGEYKKGGAGQYVFEFTPEEYGEYVVTVKVNGELIDNVFFVQIEEPAPDNGKLYTYIAIGIAGGIILVFAICFGCYFLQRRAGKIKSDD
ncbi:MAG: S8 family serine peptidase [Clostridia bacterium]|nr:S8 family serine peptidase [Clostridia bacterium]